MGAELCMQSIKGDLTEEQVRIEFDKIVAQALWDHGHAGYSGTFAEVTKGVRVHHHVHTNEHSAHGQLDGLVEKWECAHAVRYLDDEGCRNWLVMAICSR